jgi:hypothetical protein
MEANLLTRETLVCGEQVRVFSLDGQHWDSDVRSLKFWHRQRDARHKEIVKLWRNKAARANWKATGFKRKKHEAQSNGTGPTVLPNQDNAHC